MHKTAYTPRVFTARDSRQGRSFSSKRIRFNRFKDGLFGQELSSITLPYMSDEETPEERTLDAIIERVAAKLCDCPLPKKRADKLPRWLKQLMGDGE